MNRDYSITRSTKEDTSPIIYFVGTEVEKTPAYGDITLFVVGCRDVDEIELQIKNHKDFEHENIEHIYIGANMSFMPKESAQLWADMVIQLLQRGYLVTWDFPVERYDEVISALGKWHSTHQNFIPMVSVKITHIQEANYNTVIKLDDADFNASNPGVWCHYLHDLIVRCKFTQWAKYKKDKILSTLNQLNKK